MRINGENPAQGFQPCPGLLGEVSFPEGGWWGGCQGLEAARVSPRPTRPSLQATSHQTQDAKRQNAEMDGVRVDTWVETGTEVSPHYDSMLAKLMVYAPTR